jgi:hypothetical protein
MRIDRDTVRIVVPPLLALGLVAALTHPADAMPVPSPTSVVQTVGR